MSRTSRHPVTPALPFAGPEVPRPGPAFGPPLDRVRPGSAVWVDGGLVGKNPAPAGTWAWCLAVPGGVRGGRHVQRSGVLTAEDVGLPAVTNNLTELLAVLAAAEALPAGWAGDLFTDSRITAGRWNRGLHPADPTVPEWLAARLALARSRVRLTARLVRGHPTAEDLARGHDGHGVPVSEHNVWCDRSCSAAARAWRASRSPATSHLRSETGACPSSTARPAAGRN